MADHDHELTLKGMESARIVTQEATVVVYVMPGVGTSVLVYEDVTHNPITTTHLKRKEESDG